jgi:glutaredoxin 3
MEDAIKVKIYSKDHCSSCVRVKLLLDQLGVTNEVVDLTGDLEGMQQVARLTGQYTLPQVFVGNELIGGYEDVQLALRNQRLREALGLG